MGSNRGDPTSPSGLHMSMHPHTYVGSYTYGYMYTHAYIPHTHDHAERECSHEENLRGLIVQSGSGRPAPIKTYMSLVNPGLVLSVITTANSHCQREALSPEMLLHMASALF